MAVIGIDLELDAAPQMTTDDSYGLHGVPSTKLDIGSDELSSGNS